MICTHHGPPPTAHRAALQVAYTRAKLTRSRYLRPMSAPFRFPLSNSQPPPARDRRTHATPADRRLLTAERFRHFTIRHQAFPNNPASRPRTGARATTQQKNRSPRALLGCGD